MSARKKILIVDDNDFILHLLETIIKDTSQYDVVKAKNGIEALDEVSKSDFDLIISDILMPKMNGIEFINKMRESNQEVPIIAISGGMGESDSRDYINYAGYFADDVIKKPFTKAELLLAVDLAANNKSVDLCKLF